jgi:enoyl-CoA hydratase
MGDEPSVLISTDGHLGRIRLNRAPALNSLTREMIAAIAAGLAAFERDDAVTTVLIDGAGERGFCAGGDIRALRESALADGTAAREFWAAEYRVNAQIARYPKPVVVVMEGIVMGGGIGLAGHASHRVATQNLRAAMPEVGIGFYPDVGGTWLLARAPGRIGEHLALTGTAVNAADAVFCGLADVCIPSNRTPQLADALAKGVSPDAAIRSVAVAEGASQLADACEWIDVAYASSTVSEIVMNLEALSDPSAVETAELIRSRSPTSLAVTLRALRAARQMATIEDVLDQDYRIACRFLETSDFIEGIRAAVVDKDRQPRWNPREAGSVTVEETERYFASLGAAELGLASSHPEAAGCGISIGNGQLLPP